MDEPTLITEQAERIRAADPAANWCLLQAENGTYLAEDRGFSDDGESKNFRIVGRIVD